MVEKTSLEFNFRKIDETRNYLLHEIKYNDLSQIYARIAFETAKKENTVKEFKNLEKQEI